MYCDYCRSYGLWPECPQCKRDVNGNLPKRKGTNVCRMCKNRGLFPFCEKCTRDVNGKKLVKDKSNYLTDDEIRERFRNRENITELARMFRNLEKVEGETDWPISQGYLVMYQGNLKTSGCKVFDQAIFSIYGTPDTWT